MKTKTFGMVSLFCLIVALLWVVFMVLSMTRIGPIDTLEQSINSVSNPDWLFYLTYLNGVITTILVTILFVCLYLYCKTSEPELSLIGLVFVPVYCVLNSFCYLSQITIVPQLYHYYTVDAYHDEAEILLSQMIQGWQGSAAWIFNNFAYAILGISSIALGLALLKQSKFAKVSGAFLILNATACIVGFAGIVAGNRIIGMGSAIGGVLFIIALVFLCFMFFKEEEQ